MAGAGGGAGGQGGAEEQAGAGEQAGNARTRVDVSAMAPAQLAKEIKK